MSAEEIRALVVEQIHRAACESVVTEDNSRLEEDCGLDLLDKVELVMDIEEKFGIFIEDEKAEKIKTVGELVKAVQEAVEKQAGEEGV